MPFWADPAPLVIGRTEGPCGLPSFCTAAGQGNLNSLEEVSMAKLVFELNQSLDGYVDHQAFGPPDPALFRHFTERVRDLAGVGIDDADAREGEDQGRG